MTYIEIVTVIEKLSFILKTENALDPKTRKELEKALLAFSKRLNT